MIIPQLNGGLCNQMFQIAACFCYAKVTDNKFAINYNLPFSAHQGKHPQTYKDSIYKNIESTAYVPEVRYKQPSFVYSDIPLFADALFEGHFQSYKYIKKFRSDLADLFCFSEDIKKRIDSALTKFNKQICTIHIRRGDYLDPQIAIAHNVCNKNYYDRCIADISDAVFLVITDDRNYVTKEFKVEFETGKFIIVNTTSELEDLYLLTQSDIIIGSNSTFSWWGAFLNKKLRRCLMPSRWFTAEGEKMYGKPELYIDYITPISV
jgi:hypothetical protein